MGGSAPLHHDEQKGICICIYIFSTENKKFEFFLKNKLESNGIQ